MSLIAHYTLDNQAGIGENLIVRSYECDVGGQSSGITTTKLTDGSLRITADGSGSWKSIRSFGTGTTTNVQNNLSGGDTMAFSFDLFIESGSGIPQAFLNSGNGYFSMSGNSTLVGKWQRVTCVRTYVTPTNLNYGYFNLHLTFGGLTGTFIVKNFKLEKNNKCTAWCPNSADTTWNQSPYNLEANIIQSQSDVEAHTPKYNGVKTGSINFTADTPKYNSATDFTASDGAITIGNLNTMLGGNNPFTFNIWFKKKTDEWSSKGWETIFGGPSGFELEMKLSGNNTNYIHPYSWGGGSTNSPNSYSIQYPLDQWNMLTMVRTTSDTKYYLNGELKVTGSAGTIPSGNYFLGAWSTINGQNYRGLMSDARIFNHTLTANQVVDLYNGGNGMVLPEGYTRLEYLGFERDNNRCCINSNLTMASNYSIETAMMLTNTSSDNQFLFSDRSSNNTGLFHVYINTSKLATYQDPNCSTITMNLNQKYIFSKIGKKCYVDNIYYGESGTTTGATQTLLIGGVDSASGSRGFYGRCYYFKISNGSQIERNFIPAKRNSDNVLGMYDVANNVFYTNSGTGTFIAGPEVN